MKKFKTMMAMMLALVSMCVAFSSCSSDDDDTVAAAKEIAGTYTSSLDMTVMGQASTYDNVTMKIEAVDDATVKVTEYFHIVDVYGVLIEGTATHIILRREFVVGTHASLLLNQAFHPISVGRWRHIELGVFRDGV